MDMNHRHTVAAAALITLMSLGGCSGGAEPVDESPELVTERITETATETVTETVTEVVTERPTAQLNELRRRLDRRDQTIDRLRERIEALENQAVAEPDTDSGAAPAFYENCDAARAAGAAPVYEGDPGYGPHLDRDRDRVGCE